MSSLDFDDTISGVVLLFWIARFWILPVLILFNRRAWKKSDIIAVQKVLHFTPHNTNTAAASTRVQ